MRGRRGKGGRREREEIKRGGEDEVGIPGKGMRIEREQVTSIHSHRNHITFGTGGKVTQDPS